MFFFLRIYFMLFGFKINFTLNIFIVTLRKMIPQTYSLKKRGILFTLRDCFYFKDIELFTPM